MINVNQLVKTGINALTDNSPAILTAFGAVGVVGTAVLTAKATFEAADRIAEDDRNRAIFEKNSPNTIQPRTKAETVKLVWPLYISAVSSGVLSCGAIIMSHRISSRRAAVLAAAYALNENRLEEYQEKVKEKLGVKKEKDVRDELTQDRVKRDYRSSEVIFSPLDGKVLVRDDYSGRFFWSSVEDVNRAVNEINHEIVMSNDGAATVSDFYDLLDLDHVSTSDYFGWNTNERLEIEWSTTTTPDGSTAVHSFEFVNPPIMHPGRSSSFR